LQSAGATVFRLPTLEIQPMSDLDALRSRLGAIAAFDLVIFTSANAVRFGAPLLDHGHHPLLAAIGPATARALRDAGFSVAVTPAGPPRAGRTPAGPSTAGLSTADLSTADLSTADLSTADLSTADLSTAGLTTAGGFDSESLLLHPALTHCAGRRVLLVKGAHGRELLEQQLALRGAKVSVAEVYRRERLRHDDAEIAALEARFVAGDIHVITATSVDIAVALLDLATPALRRGFNHAHWVVPGARVADAVRERGVLAPIVRAVTAEDQDLIAAIERWRASESGA
jgi:uroporphyrinogen-III synthase